MYQSIALLIIMYITLITLTYKTSFHLHRLCYFYVLDSLGSLSWQIFLKISLESLFCGISVWRKAPEMLKMTTSLPSKISIMKLMNKDSNCKLVVEEMFSFLLLNTSTAHCNLQKIGGWFSYTSFALLDLLSLMLVGVTATLLSKQCHFSEFYF